ncbi:cation transporter [Coprothermobacter proteolyticus DSM 5265]|uniref:Cation efflux system protein (Zinc/cadmium) n=1 Tax=Coprothermobacter proteolyticus (strain ATCC 35245 / DSM 5265 / OCM 4 / BT) TaxID=309798 RepID=B5YA25_COPPD|nr:cation diffusion facilitator family transporter [Coprothermobacter proteolyticus]ACI16968.1 cation transporter [Coprothermobacter proteolyticus DSM 5265]
MKTVRDYQPAEQTRKSYVKAFYITIIGNLLLVAVKAVVASLTGSAALYAETANSASDVVYSLLMVFGLWISQKPPDHSHPQGHSRFEPLVGLLVTFSMAFAGYQAASTSILKLLAGGIAVKPGLPTLVLVMTAITKGVMYYAILQLSQKTQSPALHATAQDNLTDVMTSSAAFLGILGSYYVSPLLDPIAGLLVSAWIFKAVIGLILENIKYITGGSADKDVVEQILHITNSVPGVLRVHELVTEYVGPRLVVEMHVNVRGDLPLTEAHRINDEIVNRVLHNVQDVDRVYVHLEPENES